MLAITVFFGALDWIGRYHDAKWLGKQLGFMSSLLAGQPAALLYSALTVLALIGLSLHLPKAVWGNLSRRLNLLWHDESKPNASTRDGNLALIDECRQMVAIYLEKHQNNEDFRDYAVRQIAFMKIRKYLPEDTIKFFTSRRIIMADWGNPTYPALVDRFLRDLDNIEKQWTESESKS